MNLNHQKHQRGFYGFSFISFFIIRVLMGFVSRGIILLIKSCFFYILFPHQAQDKNVCARISEHDIL